MFVLLLATYSVIVFWGCYNIQSQFFLPVVCSADVTEKQIAISFDDGPTPHYTSDVLKILNDKNIEAAFFCIGKRIKEHPAILTQIHEGGHLIGNHSYSHHFWFDLYSTKKMQADLAATDKMVKEVTGLTPKLFRPPYGVINPMVKKAIVKGAYIPIGWSVRSMDTVIKDEKQLLQKVCNALRPGAIFLFHDTSASTISALPLFIDYAIQEGYEIIRLDKLLKLHPYA